MIRKIAVALLLLAFCLPLAIGQQPAQTPNPQSQKPVTPAQNPPEVDSQDVVKITTNLVQVDAVVTKDGKQVTDLKPEDFELFEEGKPQVITNFSYISNVLAAPATVASAPLAKDKAAKDKYAPPVPPAVARPHDVR